MFVIGFQEERMKVKNERRVREEVLVVFNLKFG